MMTNAGLSSYAGGPTTATAGLGVLLGTTLSPEILDTVRVPLERKHPFKVVEKDGVVVMGGKDEAIDAWITVNNLLDTIRADSPSGAHTYADLDLAAARR